MIGRFAPSPTGPLHFGSLVAAVASYVDARSCGGKWLVRMEDIDTPRVVAGADADILWTLERFGFEWDGPVVYQSTRLEAYREALERLRAIGAVYGCSCSRTTTEPCRCTGGPRWRVRFGGDDFTVLRADGIFAYQLAVVVDDEWQEITDVVRGADLLDSTPRQMHLQKLLGYRTPRYVHVPVVTNEKGEKLSKQTLAPALDLDAVPELLTRALFFLGLEIPVEVAGAGKNSISGVGRGPLASQTRIDMISCRNLTRRFGEFTAVDNLNFEVASGAICAFLGPNGAGKSTTVKMLTGLLPPSSGEAEVCGLDVRLRSIELKRRIGVLPEDLGLFDDLTVEEHLSLTGDVYGLDRRETRARTDQLLRTLKSGQRPAYVRRIVLSRDA